MTAKLRLDGTAARLALSLVSAVVLVCVLIELLGASATTALSALVHGAAGSPLNVGQTVMLASVLSLTALAAGIPFSAHMWNVGAEGQLYVGAVASCAVGLGLSSSTPRWLTLTLLVLAGTLAGALWGAIPGIMKAKAKANEVITSLMLLFVATLLASYATTNIWPSGLGLSTRDLPSRALLPTLSSATGITLGAVLAALAVLGAWLLMSRSTLGFQIRAVGFNARAAAMNGMPVARVQIISFTLGGAAAGLAGSILVAGIYGGLIAGSAAGYGFLGIAVALVARLSPAWVIPSALLFAALHVGSHALKVEAGISSSVGDVLVGVFIVTLLAFGVIRLRYPEAAE